MVYTFIILKNRHDYYFSSAKINMGWTYLRQSISFLPAFLSLCFCFFSFVFPLSPRHSWMGNEGETWSIFERRLLRDQGFLQQDCHVQCIIKEGEGTLRERERRVTTLFYEPWSKSQTLGTHRHFLKGGKRVGENTQLRLIRTAAAPHFNSFQIKLVSHRKCDEGGSWNWIFLALLDSKKVCHWWDNYSAMTSWRRRSWTWEGTKRGEMTVSRGASRPKDEEERIKGSPKQTQNSTHAY